MYIGMDLHKLSIQVAIMDGKGEVLRNKKIKNTHAAIKSHFAGIPRTAHLVMESSSVWYDTYRFLTDALGFVNVSVSNPYTTKAIAASKKKTDKVDAYQLAN